jgi:hypothetical protein
MPFAMVCPIDLLGAALTTETGTLDCEPLACVGGTHAAKRIWWASKRGGADTKLVMVNTTGNPTQAYRVRFGVNTIGDATVEDVNGNPINLTNYPNRIVAGTYHAWMKNGSTQINAIRAIIKVKVKYTQYDTGGSTPAETDTNGNIVNTVNSGELSCNITLTNAAAGVTNYTGGQYTALAETPVTGLAQNVYTSRATLDYDGSHEIVDPGILNGGSPTIPLAQLIGHWNVLNLSGGASAWATANMTIASTEIDLMTNHIRIEVGPSKHLQPQDWSSMLQFFRYRRLYIDSSVRATGYGSQNNNADMPLNTADENNVQGLFTNVQNAFFDYGSSVAPAFASAVVFDAVRMTAISNL